MADMQGEDRGLAEELAVETTREAHAATGTGADPVAQRALGLPGIGGFVSDAALGKLKEIGEQELAGLYAYLISRVRSRIGG